MKVEKEIQKYWDGDSEEYQETATIPTDSVHYGPFAPNENKLKLLGNVKGKKVLELGCGGGQCSIAFAKQGAKVTGLDLSKEQLNFAKALAEKEKVTVEFINGSFMNLKKIKSNNYDLVFSAFAFQYSSNLKKLFKQVHRVLKKRGLFVFSLDHPFYSLIDEKSKKIKRSYFKIGKIEEKYDSGTFIAFRRRVSDIYNALVGTNFNVEKIIEPLELRNQKAWTKDYWEEVYPLNLIKLIGPTIIFKTKKKE